MNSLSHSLRIPLLALLLAAGSASASAQWRATASSAASPVSVSPAAGSGLDEVIVARTTAGLSLSYTAASADAMRLHRFTVSGSSSTLASFEQSGATLTVGSPQAGGYWVEQGGRLIASLWLVDYSSLPTPQLALSVEQEASGCDYAYLTLTGDIASISYKTIDGRTEQVAREFVVSWQTLVWDEEQQAYLEQTATETKSSNYRSITVDAPLLNTTFTFAGDQFLRAWGEPLSTSTAEYTAIAVSGEASAEQHVREAGNELDKETADLSGSAPVDISFRGWRTAPTATYGAWQLSRYAEFDIVDATYPDDELDYSFDTEGTTYVCYLVSNADNTCEKVVATYTVSVSESSLQVPNVFTPDDPSGSNTLFKVAYRSIVKFDARVFNRWGRQLYHWTDPAQGWDGKVGGKTVPTGAYYYIIEATGAGGKKYKLKGDINVLRTKE